MVINTFCHFFSLPFWSHCVIVMSLEHYQCFLVDVDNGEQVPYIGTKYSYSHRILINMENLRGLQW